MQSLRSSEVRCKVCDGHGEVDIGWMGCIIEKCGNCEGTGKVDWIRNVIPLHYNEDTREWTKGKQG